MNDMTTTRMLMTTAVLAAVAALLAGPAHAVPVDTDGGTGIVVVTAPAMAVPVDPDGGTGVVVVTAPAMAQVEQSLGLTGDSALTRQQSAPTDVHGALHRDRSSQTGAALRPSRGRSRRSDSPATRH